MKPNTLNAQRAQTAQLAEVKQSGRLTMLSFEAALCTGIEANSPNQNDAPFGDPENPALKQKSREAPTSRADFRRLPKR